MNELNLSNNTKKILSCIVFVMVSLLLCANPVHAASQKTLKSNKTYKKYDVTGDGKADTIRIITSNNGGWCKTAKIKLNGKTACVLNLEDDNIYNCAATLITLNNKKPFLFMSGTGDNDDIAAYILQYNMKTKKYDVIVNFRDLFCNTGCMHSRTYLHSVKGNKIVIRQMLMTYSLSTVYVEITYKYKSGTLQQDDSLKLLTVASGGTLTANRKLVTYKTASCKTQSFTIKKNQKVKIKGVALKKGNLRFKVKVDGRTAWLKSAKKNPSKQWFKELQFAG